MPLKAPEPRVSRGAPLTLAERYLERALDYYTKKKVEDAIADLDAALEVEPHNGELYATRGYIHYEAGDQAAAEADFTKALQIDPRQWLAHYTRAVIAYKQGEYDAALRHITLAERIVPQRPEVLIYKAAAHFYKNEKPQAMAAIDGAQANMNADDKRMREAKKWAKAIKQMAGSEEAQ